VFLLIAIESFAQADQQNDRSDSPDDSEHRQEAAQFVRGYGSGGLTQNFPNVQRQRSSLFWTFLKGKRKPEFSMDKNTKLSLR
jgi:hypothetical protein